MKEILKKLINIQNEIKVSKDSMNDFGKYKYRTLDSIYQEIKPILKKYNCTLITSDDLVQIGERYYIKATAFIYDNESGENVVTTAYARESLDKKGMDSSQITGASSTYAKKYAVGALFNIDDTKDADSMDNREVPKDKNSIIDKIVDVIEVKNLDQFGILNRAKVKDLEELTLDKLEKVLAFVQKEESKRKNNISDLESFAG